MYVEKSVERYKNKSKEGYQNRNPIEKNKRWESGRRPAQTRARSLGSELADANQKTI